MAVTFKVTVVISSSAGTEGGLCNDTLADLIFTNLRVFTGKDSEFDRGQVTYQRPHHREEDGLDLSPDPSDSTPRL